MTTYKTARNPNLKEAQLKGNQRMREKADEFAAKIYPMLEPFQLSTLKEKADLLNTNGVPSARGGKWTINAVQRLIARAVMVLKP